MTAPYAQNVSRPGCGTAAELMSLQDDAQGGSLSSGGQAASVAGATRVTRSMRTAAQTLRGRTLLTPHFAIHYTLAPTVNRVRLEAVSDTDATVKRQTDSLLATLGSLSGSRRDSALHARLDTIGAPHPLYITQAAAYFERAWNHYDSIGMRMPDSSRSLYYIAAAQGRVAIDIADIGTMAPGYLGEPIYGLAFPPSGSQRPVILFENDFLYGASYNASLDRVSGTPIRSYHKGTTYRDYSVQWDMGLKVTASHEFYHIVQYEYTDNLSNPHAWYELSATGMEERLAPEVNDYFQYLPFNVSHNHDISLLVSRELANYGNAIFHVFLSKARGYGFDRAVWEALADNNNLPGALVQAAGTADKWDSLWTAYAAAMSISGTPGSATSALAFSPDMAEWPMPRFDTVPPSSISQLRVPAATYRLIRPPVTDTGFINLVRMERGIRVDSTAAGYVSTALAPDFALTKTSGVTQRTVAAVNSSFNEQKEVLMWKRGLEPTLVQNPVKRTPGGSVILLAPSLGGVDSLRVVAETGRRIATVPANSSQAYWRWNLKDHRDSLVPSGTYYIRRTGQTPLPVIITP